MPGLIRSVHHEDGFPLESLLQELLMALLGYTGDVFIDSSTAGYVVQYTRALYPKPVQGAGSAPRSSASCDQTHILMELLGSAAAAKMRQASKNRTSSAFVI